jgi:hypothetical protein
MHASGFLELAYAVVVRARRLSLRDLLVLVLALALDETADWEVKELDRIPAAQRNERRFE